MKTTHSKAIPPLQLEEGARLREIFEERQEAAKLKGKRLSQASVGAACGWASAQSIMSQLMTGKMRLGLEALVRLAHVLKFRPEEVSPRLAETIDLIAMLNASKLLGADPTTDAYRLPVTTGSVPVTLKADINELGEFTGGDKSRNVLGLLSIHCKDKAAFAVMIQGNSMSPRLRSHEFIVVEPGHAVESGDDVLVTLKDGHCLIKEFMYHRDGLYRFDSIKPGIEPMFLDEHLVETVEYIDAVVKKTRFEPVAAQDQIRLKQLQK